MVKRAGVVAWLGGIAALIGLATWSGLGAVGQAVSSVGWGILLVVLARAVALVVAGLGWWLLFPSKMRPQLRTCVLLRFVREATNVLLPLAQVGGDLIGAGLLTLYAVPGALAAASVIVDSSSRPQHSFCSRSSAFLPLLRWRRVRPWHEALRSGLRSRRSCSRASIWRNAAAGNVFFEQS